MLFTSTQSHTLTHINSYSHTHRLTCSLSFTHSHAHKFTHTYTHTLTSSMNVYDYASVTPFPRSLYTVIYVHVCVCISLPDCISPSALKWTRVFGVWLSCTQGSIEWGSVTTAGPRGRNCGHIHSLKSLHCAQRAREHEWKWMRLLLVAVLGKSPLSVLASVLLPIPENLSWKEATLLKTPGESPHWEIWEPSLQWTHVGVSLQGTSMKTGWSAW